MQNKIARDLIDFLNSAPTPFATVSELKKRLRAAGGKEISLSEITPNLTDGGLYYTVFGEACIAAFIKGNTLSNGVKIAGAHTDCPGLRIKPNPSRLSGANEPERLNVEFYGGAIHHTWLDRPLKLAGRIAFMHSTSKKAEYVDIDVKDTTLVIPSAAIHLVRDVNDGAKFSIQNELLPFFSEHSESEKPAFLKYLAKEVSAACGTPVDPDDILSFDIALTDAAPACFSGINNEFISAPGLDDKSMVHAIFTALCENTTTSSSEKKTSTKEEIIPCIAFAFNHEECGSLSHSGARSVFTPVLVKAVCAAAAGKTNNDYSDAEFLDTMQKSFALSSDMAHAKHPAYPSKTDPHHSVYMGKGPALKTASNQNYATSVYASAQFVALCKKANIPYQQFSANSDSRGGGTIGAMLSAALGITTADIGNPMLAMHSARELCSVADQAYAVALFKEFFI